MDAETPAGENRVVSLVLHAHQLLHLGPVVEDLACSEDMRHVAERNGIGEAEDAGDGGNDNHIAALHERERGRKPHAVNLRVDVRVFLYVEVLAGDVGLRLVVVVCRDEVLHPVFREEGLELPVKLRRKGLVVRENQRRALDLLDDLGHGEGLSRAGDSLESLEAVAVKDSLSQGVYCLLLVARDIEGRMHDKRLVYPFDGSVDVADHVPAPGGVDLARAGTVLARTELQGLLLGRHLETECFIGVSAAVVGHGYLLIQRRFSSVRSTSVMFRRTVVPFLSTTTGTVSPGLVLERAVKRSL